MAGLDKRPRQPPIVRRLSFLNCLSAQWKQSRQAAVALIPDIQAPIGHAPKRTVLNHHELMRFSPTRVHSSLGFIQEAPLKNVSWNKACQMGWTASLRH